MSRPLVEFLFDVLVIPGNNKFVMLEQVNHNLIDQPLDWCVPKPGVKKPVTQDHHRQTNDLKGSAIKVYRLRGKKKEEKKEVN